MIRQRRDPVDRRDLRTSDSVSVPPGPPLTTDTELVIRTQQDPLAFAQLYQRYLTPVYRYCYRQTSDPDVAADLTALIFTKALEAIPRFKPRDIGTRDRDVDGCSTFRSWLFAIAHNAIIDRRRRERTIEPLDPTYHQVTDPNDGPETLAIHQDELARLIAALDRIPDSHRHIIELRLAGLTAAEIAETLGISRAAVKSAQTRAYSRLRDLLEPPDPQQGTDLRRQFQPPSPAEESSR